MRIMISSEALHKGVTKVKQATPSSSMNDKDEIMIQTEEDGIFIRRQGSQSYAEFFLYCSVTEQGTIVAKAESFKFLEHAVGDKVFYLDKKTLRTNDDDSILTISSGEWDYFAKKRPETEFYPVEPIVNKTLWSVDPTDLVVGHLYFSGSYFATTDRSNFSVVHLTKPLPFKAIFPVGAISTFRDQKEEYMMTVEDNMVWFKKGGFVVGSAMTAEAKKMPLHFDTISQATTEGFPFFEINKDELSRLISQIVTHATSSALISQKRASCRISVELKEDGIVFFESNWSQLGQIKRTLKPVKHSDTLKVSIVGQHIAAALPQLDGETVKFYMISMMGQTWPCLIEGNNKFVLAQTDFSWTYQNEPPRSEE